MAKRWWFVLVFLLCAATTVFAQATIPDTAAGRTFKAFLEAFNSGDRAQIETFCRRIYGEASNPNAIPPPDAQMQFMTSGTAKPDRRSSIGPCRTCPASD
jgi:hypothetical protein